MNNVAYKQIIADKLICNSRLDDNRRNAEWRKMGGSKFKSKRRVTNTKTCNWSRQMLIDKRKWRAITYRPQGLSRKFIWLLQHWLLLGGNVVPGIGSECAVTLNGRLLRKLLFERRQRYQCVACSRCVNFWLLCFRMRYKHSCYACNTTSQCQTALK